MSRQVHKLL